MGTVTTINHDRIDCYNHYYIHGLVHGFRIQRIAEIYLLLIQLMSWQKS